tara:strand:- start:5497 stop:7902 length:2406 start_codon:yes stop_codon:yes gene_type:complete
MAERIVSPGVFTQERDLSFLPQGVADIGAAIIGPTTKGPAFTPTVLNNYSEFEEMFGGLDKRFYTPYTIQQYLRSAGSVTVVRVLGLGGYKPDIITLSCRISGSTKDHALAVLAPSRGAVNGTGDLTPSTGSGTFTNYTLVVSGSDVTTYTKTISFSTGSANYIGDVLSTDPQIADDGAGTTVPVYLYKNFKGIQHSTGSGAWQSAVTSSTGTLDLNSGVTTFDADGNADTWTGNKDYNVARTPYIQSQLVAGARYNLFRVYTRSHGTNMNKAYKTNILNIKAASSVAGSDYGTFSLQVRHHAPNKTKDNQIVEQYDNLTFDPDAPNYFAKMIGDRFVEIDSNGKLTYKGDYPNLSKHIRVGDYKNLETMPTTVVPMGHSAVYIPVASAPSASFVHTQQNTNGDFDSNIFYGFDFDMDKRPDNGEYLSPIYKTGATTGNPSMSLENMLGHADASTLSTTFSDATEKITLSLSAIGQRKFTVPFQWGFDGDNPGNPKLTGNDISATNTMGFDLSSATASGSIAYKRAINAVSNPDEFDINLLATPGVIHRLHPKVTNHAILKVEARADAFYVMDAAAYGDTIATVTNTVSALDTNYAGTYYPWVKIVDGDTNRPVWVPPSVVLPGVIAFTDKVAHEWFAPAGLNRGGLTTVLEAKTRLTHAERDDLYEERVNPIASFPGQGVVVFGQKTLQSKPSALDRINVRRLLIALKKFIASSSRYLVFEQNTVATRNRFLNIVNPYLESVQSNSGLSAFRVVMDETNNTPDVVDRNRLVGQIFIQPTRTAEFIVLDFVVQPTGASFPE